MNHANIEVLRRTLARERLARLEAEKLLEDRSRELFETQQHLVQSEKMASIGQMAAGIAHEINNPMGYLHGNLECLKDWVDEFSIACKPIRQQITDNIEPNMDSLLSVCSTSSFHDVHEMIEDATEGVWKVVDIVKALQMFTHMGEAQKIPFSLREELEPMIHNFIQENPNAQININISEDFIVNGAADELVQACQHLIKNALQATNQKGTITIKAIHKKEKEFDEDQVYLTIQDDGPGVESTLKHQIFEPFFSNLPVGSGTGLGLTLAQAIAKTHGGFIKLEDNGLPGACFSMTLPIS